MPNLEQRIVHWRVELASAMPQQNEIVCELEDHLRDQIDHLRKEGLSPDVAFEASVKQIGDARTIAGQFSHAVLPFRTQSPRDPRQRASWLSRSCDTLFADIWQAQRQLRKSQGMAAASVATLALCIGATTAIFSMVYALMLKPLPFHEADRLVEIYDDSVKTGPHKMPSNVVQYLDYSKHAKSYESLGLWNFNEVTFGDGTDAERMPIAGLTADMFDVLKLKPVIGRFFTKEENRPNQNKVVVLTQSFWEAYFGGDPEVLDKMVKIDGGPYKIIGVAPRALEAFDARVKFVRAFAWQPALEDPRGRYSLSYRMFGRLKPGVTVGQAVAEAGKLTRRYYDVATPQARAFMDHSGITEAVVSVQADRVEPVKVPLYLLQGGVAFVLLIGCVNIASLKLVHANGRLSDLAIRFSLGASSGTIVRQLMAESMVLTGIGALLGTVLAWGALQVVNRYTATMLPQALPMTLDWPVLTFAVALTVVAGVIFGLIPVVHLSRMNLMELIHRGSRGASAGRGVRALSNIFVVGPVTISLILLAGAGLLIHSFAKAVNVNPGLDPRGVVTGRIAPPVTYRKNDDTAKDMQERLLQALREIPGVSSAALSFYMPFQGGLPCFALHFAENPLPLGSPQALAYVVPVSPEYLTTLGLTLVQGRFFEEADKTPGRRSIVVDESFARKFFPGRSAVGGLFTFNEQPEKDSDWLTIVGVVRDVAHNGVEDRTGIPFVYAPVFTGSPYLLTLFLRSTLPAVELVPEMSEKIHGFDPAIVLFDTATLESRMDSSFDNRRAVMLLLVTFAGLALFLSALGIYGVLAYDVSQRTREIGIRGVIGATPWQVIAMILKQGLWRAGVGLVLGLVGAWLLSRFMTSLLFEVTPTDPIVYAGVSLLLLIVAAFASYLPARRAAKIDPLEALRME